MARLPQPGGDQDIWGNILNEFLAQAHDTDGFLKTGSVGAGQLQDGSVTNAKLDGPTQTTLSQVSGKEPEITPTSSADYYRGDKTFQPLNKAAVGLSSVDNTSDAAKPISSATQSALDGLGSVSFRTTWLDISNNYGSTSWVFQPVPNNGSTIGGMPFFGGYNQSGTGTGIEELSYDIWIRGGTWTFAAYYVKGPNLGNFTVLIDTTESTVIDTYQASYGSVMTTILVGTALTTGVHTVTIRKKGTKNVSSSAYFVLWSGVMGIRTGA